MSEQTRDSDSTNWAIIKQLMNEGVGPALGNGQRIDVAAPQAVSEGTFNTPVASPQSAAGQEALPQGRQPQTSVEAFVAAAPEAVRSGRSLLDSIASSLKPASVTEISRTDPDAPEPQVAIPKIQSGAASLQSASQNAMAPTLSAESPRFKQLFSSASASSLSTLPKETPLQPLLERIASCR